MKKVAWSLHSFSARRLYRKLGNLSIALNKAADESFMRRDHTISFFSKTL